ncbi:hypothetical protein E2C01_024131 [Portunus trituberculatus]|uniref:Uncharacterized protein n=1 Tax=Portunus trituberculatus TaxID=210409 RepID=A0A5B7E9J5_PORTR|nr:hypothetical protein [Portunus trituberculatus]
MAFPSPLPISPAHRQPDRYYHHVALGLPLEPPTVPTPAVLTSHSPQLKLSYTRPRAEKTAEARKSSEGQP